MNLKFISILWGLTTASLVIGWALDGIQSSFTGAVEEDEYPSSSMMFATDIAIYKDGMSLCQRNNRGMSSYAGTEGSLADGDCAALYYFALMQIFEASKKARNTFKYIETGSFQGLSAHVISTAIIGASLINGIVYSHDLFDEVMPSGNSDDAEFLWEESDKTKEMTRLQLFYSHVKRNGLEGRVIPIAGTNSIFSDAVSSI